MSTYFHNLKNGIQTVFEGMSISLATMFARPCTIQYPDDDIRSEKALQETYRGQLRAISENYRGILNVNMDICTACQLCAKNCPIDCIAIKAVKCDKVKVQGTKGKEAVKTRTCTRFDIHAGKCMHCGLCAMACPTGAIHHTLAFEMNRHRLEDLVLEFVNEEERERAIARDGELAKEAAAKRAAKAAAKAKAEKEAGSGDEAKETVGTETENAANGDQTAKEDNQKEETRI